MVPALVPEGKAPPLDNEAERAYLLGMAVADRAAAGDAMFYDYKKVFVLGAGFSKSFSSSIPTIQDLNNALYDVCAADKPDRYRRLREFARRYYERSNQRDELRSLENLATVIFSKVIFRNPEEELEFQNLRYELLRFIYDKTRVLEISPENEAVLVDFLRFCGKDPADRQKEERLVISFNYDLILEQAYRKAFAAATHPIFYGVELNLYDAMLSGRQGMPRLLEIIKLHGSFNWFRVKGSSSNDISSVFEIDESAPGIHEDDVPVFIPMAHTKELFLTGPLYSTLWAKAIRYLDKAREIVFIGYGFPPTDINNLVLFLNYKEKIRHVVIHYERPDHPNLCRLQQIFGSTVVRNEDAKEFLKKEYLR